LRTLERTLLLIYLLSSTSVRGLLCPTSVEQIVTDSFQIPGSVLTHCTVEYGSGHQPVQLDSVVNNGG